MKETGFVVKYWRRAAAAAAAIVVVSTGAVARGGFDQQAPGQGAAAGEGNQESGSRRRAKNVIFFVGDGMGVSTVTATRVFSVGLDGQLVLDQFPYTALSKTYSADSITPDSAPTMTAMMTGINTNQSVIGYGAGTEPNDFNKDGDGEAPWTLLEMAKARGMRVGVVSTAEITHATPAATYAHINQRNNQNDIALQALPTATTYNHRLRGGLDLLMGGGRRHFVPSTVKDEEGDTGARTDGRDLRAEFQKAGYRYVWNQTQFDQLEPSSLPVLGLFERSHMEFDYDRPKDLGGEPSIKDLTVRAVHLLEAATRQRGQGYFLHVEAGRIDHAHHAGNAYRALTDTQALDDAIGAAAQIVDLRETLIIVSSDHSHVFNIAGYPMRPLQELPYRINGYAPGYEQSQKAGHGILDVVWDLNQTTGFVEESTDRNGVPYTALGYHNGPGYRGAARVDPRTDPFKGFGGATPKGPADPAYYPESAVPMGSETHSGEDVAIYAIGPGAERVRGTVKNTHIFQVMRRALGL
jgi:alkaline phosphatase